MHGQQVGVPSENHHSSPTRKICSKPNIPLMNCIIWEHLGVGRELWDIPTFPHHSKSAVSPVIALEVVSIFAIRLRKPFLFSETPFRTPDLIIAASILSSESLLDVAEFFDLSDRVQATKNDRSFLFIPIARLEIELYRIIVIFLYVAARSSCLAPGPGGQWLQNTRKRRVAADGIQLVNWQPYKDAGCQKLLQRSGSWNMLQRCYKTLFWNLNYLQVWRRFHWVLPFWQDEQFWGVSTGCGGVLLISFCD